jgi:hypothetical protein
MVPMSPNQHGPSSIGNVYAQPVAAAPAPSTLGRRGAGHFNDSISVRTATASSLRPSACHWASASS